MVQAKPEAQRILNLVPSRNTEKDWRLEHAVASSAITAPAKTLPASVDLRESWWDIGDQEATGSCVGWSSTDGVARYHFVKAKKLAKTARLSPRFTWMASKETDAFTSRAETFIEEAGTSLKAAVEILRKYGAAPEALLPFHISTNLYLGKEQTFYATTAKLRIASYFNLGKDVSSWRTWLATHGPILSGLYVDENWYRATATQGKLDKYNTKTAGGGHAIAIVGYTADKRFIVRNSWGTTWGDQGFAYVSEAYIAAGFYNESYGITI
ncbi:MAG: C1 family peptidase [Nitrosomonadales bacterium]|nr:C1 family peptidase [Nitrosomonadales bacterium]